MKKPFTFNGKRFFPMENQQQFGWLKPGEMFTTKYGLNVYTKSIDDYAVCEGESKYFPPKMPVLPVKHY